VEAEVIVGDHYKARRKLLFLGVENSQPSHEGLAAPITTPKEFDATLTVRDEFELPVELSALFLDPHGEGIDSTLRHQPLAELFKDMLDISVIHD
jgi:hypothetical protein